MTEKWLECVACGYQESLQPSFFGCARCREQGQTSRLEVRYRKPLLPQPDPAQRRPLNQWRDLLPVQPADQLLSLGEGDTPLLQIGDMWVKNETLNPTWSWKDRPNSVSVSVAAAHGFRRTGAVSTGNHGNALAAYSAKAGLACTVFCHEAIPPLQVRLMKAYGADVRLGGYQEHALLDMVRHEGLFPCTTLSMAPGFSNPFGVEGFKTIAFEIWNSMGGRVPPQVFVPTGSGDGFYGIWKGFHELAEFGYAKSVPRMMACQAAQAASLFHAFQNQRDVVEPLSSAQTIALSVGERATGDHALRAVRQSGGDVLLATEDEIRAAQRELLAKGLALEPSSALAWACAQRSAAEGAVVIVTGALPKWPESIP